MKNLHTPETTAVRTSSEVSLTGADPQLFSSNTFSVLWSFIRDLPRSKFFRRIAFLAAGLVVILIFYMISQIYLNRWQGDFFHSIERRDVPSIRENLIRFTGLIALSLTLVVSQTFMHQRLKIRMREWLTHRMLDSWLTPGRAYRLTMTSEKAVDPDQRIQDDCRNFSELTGDLGAGFLQASLLLLGFIGVLWAISSQIHFEWQGRLIQVPGYMVWIALFYAGIGSWVTALVGRPLIKLNETRYQREAEFRFSVVRVNESIESVAFFSGEKDENLIIKSMLRAVVETMGKMSSAMARLTWITSGYGWTMIVLPVLMALPGYLQGTLDLGGLMMVVDAFGHVQQSLRWFVDNFPKIADWRAAMHRVAVFRDAIDEVDCYEEGTEQIQLLPHPEGHLSFENLRISLVDGEAVITDATAHIHPGERVLITGESGSGKSTLLRAAGGLWPWGSGIIRRPPREKIMFLPQRPYMPLGTLASALAYPQRSEECDRERMIAALDRVNLSEFIPQLDVNERWDRLMSLGQQQRLAFARLLLHKPEWVFLDEATSALDDENQARVMSLFTTELAGTSVLSVGHRPGLADFHTRALQLVSTKEGTVLRRRPRNTSPSIWKPWRAFKSSEQKN
jgi:putative ATP-binding cassette transporter